MTNQKHIIMANEEKEVIIDSEENNDVEEESEGTEGQENKDSNENVDKGEGKKQDKPVETPAERVARLDGMLRRAKKDAGMLTEEPKQKSSKKSEGFDYGEKAFLTANGIKGIEEHEFAQRLQKQTGLDLDTLLEDNYFKTKLTEFRETTATANAIPTGTKRSNNSSVDSVEYWISKGELPPKDQVELRRKVVNARLKKEDSKGVFYNS